MINTEIADKMLKNKDLDKAGYTFAELCRVRDCLLMLKSINPLFCDKTLLQETLKYIKQKEEK